MFLVVRVARSGPKVGQIGPKCDKSRTFSSQISVHFGSMSQNELKSDLKMSRIYPISVQSDLLLTLWPNLTLLVGGVRDEKDVRSNMI